MRLFLAGKWRKVTVSDVVPVGLDGKPLIASSVQQLELWPTILAKAVYTVYHACGYSSSLGTLQADGIATGRFLGFVLHLLHGWTPSLPIDLRSAYPPAAGMVVGAGGLGSAVGGPARRVGPLAAPGARLMCRLKRGTRRLQCAEARRGPCG